MRCLFKLSFILFLMLLITLKSIAQHPEAKRATHWYFGNGAGLDFSSGSPVAVTNSQMNAGEACSSISDVNGNLLFYTNGDTVWDKNHNVMPNGHGLNGCESSVQGALIIPQPNNPNLFYIFTTDCENFFGTGLNYSIVDLSLNSGNGDILNSQKNIFLTDSVMESLTAFQKCDTVWLMTHKGNSNDFLFYKITNQGLNTTPIINSIGSIPYYVSTAKFSPSGKKLVLVSGFSNPTFIELYDFNEGVLSNMMSLAVLSGEYGVEFSPNESMIYVATNGNMIFQFDISSNNQSIINASKSLIYDSFDNSSFFGIQNATNKKIYVSSSDIPAISEINNPNNQGLSSNFNFLNITTSGKLSSLGLPNYNVSYFDTSITEPCLDDTVIVSETPKIGLIIPNTFTPNNDGFNDLFTISLNGYEEINWRIYNRWGSELKIGELRIENNGMIVLWDGRTNSGIKVPDGTYYYIINLTKKGGEHETKKGFIQILN